MTEIATTHGGCRYYMALYRSGATDPYKRTCTLTGYSCLYDPGPQFSCERKRFAELSQGWRTFDPHDTQRPYDALFGP